VYIPSATKKLSLVIFAVIMLQLCFRIFNGNYTHIWSTVELHDASHFWHSPPNSASVATSPCQHRTTSSTKESCHRQTGGEASAHESWPLHHDISNPPQLCLPSRKPLWHQLEPVEINCQWRESWKSATVRWSMPTSWTTHNPTAGFCSPLTTVVSPEPLPHQTRSLRCL